jgi:hypothetical protein
MRQNEDNTQSEKLASDKNFGNYFPIEKEKETN